MQILEPIIRTRNLCFSLSYQYLLKPILFRFDPEDIHDHFTTIGSVLGKYRAGRAFTRVCFSYQHPMLEQNLLGINFKNPVGLAAGFDKNAHLTQILPEVGFGFEEIGSITGEACWGNERPRLWRHPEKQSLRVYYGLKNDGAEEIAKRLKDMTHCTPVGVSIAKTNCLATADTETAIQDYKKAFDVFLNQSDYITINISCPNAYGGQPFTDKERYKALLAALPIQEYAKPVFVKLSPDLTEEELYGILKLSKKYGVKGMISSNLTKDHDHGNGGLSGKAVTDLSLKQISFIKTYFPNDFLIIAVGGIFTAEDAYRAIRAGASLMQLITGMIFRGPQTIGEINQGLVRLLKRDGFSHISQAIGADLP